MSGQTNKSKQGGGVPNSTILRECFFECSQTCFQSGFIPNLDVYSKWIPLCDFGCCEEENQNQHHQDCWMLFYPPKTNKAKCFIAFVNRFLGKKKTK